MKRLWIAVVALLLIGTLVLSGCAGSAPMPNSYSGGSADFEVREEAPGVPAVDSGTYNKGFVDIGTGSDATGYDTSSVLEPTVSRKVVYTGNIVANTKTFDEDYEKIISNLRAAGGYVQDSGISGTKPTEWQDTGRTAQMTLRIPSSKFDAFIDMLKGIGDNVSSSISGNDISLTYFDTQAQLETLKIRQQRLQDMMKNPDYPLADLIQVEKELSDVSYQIQSLETSLRTYDSLIDFSTVNITLYEKHDVQSVTPVKESFGTRISNAFYSSLNGLRDFGEGFVVFISGTWPLLIFLGALTFFIIWLVKRSNRKQKTNALPPFPQGGSQNEQK